MRHSNSVRKFGRTTDARRALLRSLAEGLIINGQIETTAAKAKELRSFVEKLITKTKVDNLHARRQAISILGTEKRAKILIEKVAPKYKERAGGYTRVIKLPNRQSDGSPMAIIQLV